MSGKRAGILVLMVTVLLLLNGCTGKPKITEDGYVELVSLSGNMDKESGYLEVTTQDNEIVIFTSDNNSDGISGHFVTKDGEVHNPFNVGDYPIDTTWEDYNLLPGKYKLVIKSSGTNYQITLREKYSE